MASNWAALKTELAALEAKIDGGTITQSEMCRVLKIVLTLQNLSANPT